MVRPRSPPPRRVSHLLYISIIGVDAIPLGYYPAKYAAEQVVVGGRVTWTCDG